MARIKRRTRVLFPSGPGTRLSLGLLRMLVVSVVFIGLDDVSWGTFWDTRRPRYFSG